MFLRSENSEKDSLCYQVKYYWPGPGFNYYAFGSRFLKRVAVPNLQSKGFLKLEQIRSVDVPYFYIW